MARKITVAQRKRLHRRDELWPDSKGLIYDRKDESGFCTIPRTLVLVSTLIKHLAPSKDPSKVYLDLWTRQRDDGFVEVWDQEEMAATCGYSRPPRNVRTWREAIDQLQELGFIRVAPKGTRKYGFLFLPHPHDVVQKLKHSNPKAVPDWWWSLFENRVLEIGATLRWKPVDDSPASLDAEDDNLPF